MSAEVVALRGRVVLPDRLLDDAVVAVAGDRIQRLVPASEWTGPEPSRCGTIAPGLVDLHCHGGGGASLGSADPGEVAAAARHHLGHGTTTLLASLVSAPAAEIARSVAVVADLVEAGGSVVGSHLEGPFLAAGHRGAHDAAQLRDGDPGLAREWLARSRGTLRMITLAPERPGAAAVASLLAAAGVIVAAGHTDADVATMADALATQDYTLVTHLFNGMAPLHHREPGPVAASLAALARGECRAELIADGIHLADETVALAFALAPPESLLLVSDAMTAAGLGDGDYTLGGLQVRVADGVARVRSEGSPDDGPDDGPIAGSTAHLADAVRRCVVEVGLDPVTVLRAAATTPADLLGLDDRGRIAPGARADLVTLDDDWAVTGVLRRGEPVAT